MLNSRSTTYPTAAKAQLSCNQKGQVAVEYILLVALSVSVAVLITKAAVSRNPQDPGILTAKWRDIISVIAIDKTADP